MQPFRLQIYKQNLIMKQKYGIFNIEMVYENL